MSGGSGGSCYCQAPDRITLQSGSRIMLDGGTIDSINTIQTIEDIKHVAPLSFCHWNVPTEGAAGSSAEAAFYNAALIAVATINAAAQWDIANDRYKLAKEYAELAKDRWDRFNGAYRPLEQSMLNEVSTTPIPKPDYLRAESDYGDWFKSVYSEMEEQFSRTAFTYCLKVDTSLVRDLNNAGDAAMSDGVNYGYRFEEDRARMKEDERWNRRANLLNLGRDLLSQSAKMATYANDALKGLSDLAGAGASGAMNMLGYLRNRNETEYATLYSGGGMSMQGMGGDLLHSSGLGLSWS